jgi:hypothetical protein
MFRHYLLALIVAITSNAANALAQSNGCKAGYVPREAVADDNVCVTSAQHKQVLADNATASSRLRGSGDQCIPGYVWREAVKGDHVCVTHEVRAETKEENEQSASHTAASGLANGTETSPKGYSDEIAARGEGKQTGSEIGIIQKGRELALLPGFHAITAEDLKKRKPVHVATSQNGEENHSHSLTQEEVTAHARKSGLAFKVEPHIATRGEAQISGYLLGIDDSDGISWIPLDQLKANIGQTALLYWTMNANPGQPYMFDCDFGANSSFYVVTGYLRSMVSPSEYEGYFYGSGSPKGTQFAYTDITTYNNHLLIPVAPGPDGTEGIGVYVELPGPPGNPNEPRFHLNGCKVYAMNQ